MKIVFWGNNNRGSHILKHLVQGGHDIAAAVSDPKFDTREDWYKSIRETAEALNLRVFSPDDVNDAQLAADLKALTPDLFILCGYSRILKDHLLAIPRYGSINLHAGKVPEYRGAAPLNWAIINGEKQLGISILEVDGGIDTGPVVAEQMFELHEDDTIQTVACKVQDLYCGLLDQALENIGRAGKIEGVAQNSKGVCWKRRTREDGRILWRQDSAERIHNLIRALTRPYPCAFCSYKSQEINILDSRVAAGSAKEIPGQIVKRNAESGSVTIACRDSLLEILACDVGGECMKPYDIFCDTQEIVQ